MLWWILADHHLKQMHALYFSNRRQFQGNTASKPWAHGIISIISIAVIPLDSHENVISNHGPFLPTCLILSRPLPLDLYHLSLEMSTRNCKCWGISFYFYMLRDFLPSVSRWSKTTVNYTAGRRTRVQMVLDNTWEEGSYKRPSHQTSISYHLDNCI